MKTTDGKRRGVEGVNPYGGTDCKSAQVERMFDSIAPAYDLMNTAMTLGLHRYWRNEALRPLAISHTDRVLDIATGTGDLVFNIYERYRPAHITGLDLSEGMLAIARKRLKKLQQESSTRVSECDTSVSASSESASSGSALPGSSPSESLGFSRSGLDIEFVAGSALDLPFPDESFDVVTVAYGVRNFENLLQGLREMHRVLRPGGRLCIIELAVPRNPIVKPFYKLYTRGIIPLIGRMVSGDGSAYSYLPKSIAACPQREEMAALMRESGFAQASWKTLTLGVIGLYHANKSK